MEAPVQFSINRPVCITGKNNPLFSEACYTFVIILLQSDLTVFSKGVTFMQRVYEFLDQHILPWPVRYLSHRFIILITIALLIPLVVYANNQTLVLLVNSYLNTMSVAVSSIVLLYATLSEVHQKQIAELQEKRAQEDQYPCGRDAQPAAGRACPAAAATRGNQTNDRKFAGADLYPRQGQPPGGVAQTAPARLVTL
jgi:hypothetical protein